MTDRHPAPQLSITDQPRRSRTVLLLIVAIVAGIGWRVALYLLNLDATLEEALLLHNIVQRDYAQLIGPMDGGQAAPPAYRWLMRWLKLHTPGEWGTRGLSLASGLAALGLFAVLARMLLRGTALWLAVALFSVSHPTATYASRAKQYAVELLFALVLYVLAAAWVRRPRPRRLIPLAVACPIAFWFAYTSIYVAAAAVAVIAAIVAFQHPPHRLKQSITLAALAGLSLASFAMLYRFDLSPTMNSRSGDALRGFWDESFMPLGNPLVTCWWFIKTHTGRIFAYPIGDKNFTCTAQCLLWLAGVWVWWRNRSRRTLALLLGPQVLLLGVSAAHIYPYGGHPRISIFLAPSICIFITCGLCHLCRKLPRRTSRAVTQAVAVFYALVAIGAVGLGAYQRACYQRPTPRDILRDVAAHASPNDTVVSLGRPLPAPDHRGWSTVYEYYLHQHLGDRAHWAGRFSPATLRPGRRVWVLHFYKPTADQPNTEIDTWLANQPAAADHRLTPIRGRLSAPDPKTGTLELRVLHFE